MAFEIDFFEFAFLIEACIPPQPIARSMFFDKVIDEYYHQMTDQQREQLYGWITRTDKFSLDDEKCQWFEARYNPKNQYLVYTNTNKKIKIFIKDGEYCSAINKYVRKKAIVKVEEI